MSDSSTVTVVCLTKDRDRFIKEIEGSQEPEIEEEGALSTLVFPDVNGAAESELYSLAKEGLVFTGNNSAGECYGEGVWCGIGGEFHEPPCDDCGNLVVAILGNGSPNQSHIDMIKRYGEAEKQIQAVFTQANTDKRG